MAPQAEQLAVPSQKGVVHIRTQGSFGGDEVQMTSRGCFLRDRNQGFGCGNCFTVQVKGIKANSFVTTVEGLDQKLKHDVILSDLKKMLRCRGDIYKTEEAGVVIRLNTDRTKEVKDFLWKNALAAKDKIICTPRV
ncbi:hypothetical protein EUGRSUZ_F03466 [Eucalyptus grandis]|uniref:SUI1 domain-containing protein n=2 Tax=Eucalyptus grandis TaxID=71139 RepID=A0A059BW45_EUCGR|nr:hypothetical protein EUGRSUZ_F03466 [Eucalyptus grandis]